MLLPISELRRISLDILASMGVPEKDAGIVTDSIVDCHRRDKGTHGLTRLPIYVRKIKAGLMTADTPITFIREAPVVSVIDAHHGFGQVAGIRAMHLAMEKAERYGIGLIGVRHSNNFGTAGYIANEAMTKGMIGIALGNSGPALAPTGGNKALLGTNPLSIAFPAGSSGVPIILDMATSAAARGKIRLAAKNGEAIPFGWALDCDGNPTNDPKAAIEGVMLPMAGAKGYGLSLAIDILAGLLPGAAFAGDVKGLNHPDQYSNYGHFIVALNIEHFTTKEEFCKGIDLLESRLKSCGETGAVLMPGESSHNKAVENTESVTVSPAVWKETTNLALELGIPI